MQKKYAFSSICKCGLCGTHMTRRAHNLDRKSTKPVWKCRIATNKGIANCPHSKAKNEKIIEEAFLDMFRLLSDNFDDVLETVLQAVENSLANDDNIEKLKRVEKEITTLTRKKKKLTDMYLDDKNSKEDYDAKNQEYNMKLNASMREKEYFQKASHRRK